MNKSANDDQTAENMSSKRLSNKGEIITRKITNRKENIMEKTSRQKTKMKTIIKQSEKYHGNEDQIKGKSRGNVDQTKEQNIILDFKGITEVTEEFGHNRK